MPRSPQGALDATKTGLPRDRSMGKRAGPTTSKSAQIGLRLRRRHKKDIGSVVLQKIGPAVCDYFPVDSSLKPRLLAAASAACGFAFRLSPDYYPSLCRVPVFRRVPGRLGYCFLAEMRARCCFLRVWWVIDQRAVGLLSPPPEGVPPSVRSSTAGR